MIMIGVSGTAVSTNPRSSADSNIRMLARANFMISASPAAWRPYFINVKLEVTGGNPSLHCVVEHRFDGVPRRAALRQLCDRLQHR